MPSPLYLLSLMYDLSPEAFATWRNVNETILTEAEAAAVTRVGRDIYSALRDLLGKGDASRNLSYRIHFGNRGSQRVPDIHGRLARLGFEPSRIHQLPARVAQLESEHENSTLGVGGSSPSPGAN